MKLDEGAFAKVCGDVGRLRREEIRRDIVAYLAALPEPEPARDRIAVVVDQSGSGTAQWLATEGRPDWRHLESFMKDSEYIARAIVHCNLPRPAEPAEIHGSVEVVS